MENEVDPNQNINNASGTDRVSFVPPAPGNKSRFWVWAGIIIGLIIGASYGFYSFKQNTEKYIETKLTLAQKIQKSLENEDYANMLVFIDELVKNGQPNEDNLFFFALRGRANQEMGNSDAAQKDYALVLPLVEKLFNTKQREYDFVFFDLARIYLQRNDLASAEEYYKKGLVINSGDAAASLELGQVYENSGQREKAISHYQGLQKSFTNSEAQFIAAYKLDQLSNAKHKSGFSPNGNIYELFPVRIYPTSDFPNLDLAELCNVLEVRLSQSCEIMPRLAIDFSKIDTLETGNLNASRFVDEAVRQNPKNQQEGYITIMLTNKNIGKGDARFLFSFQDYDRDVAIVSVSTIGRFLPQIAEKNLVLNRRVALQLISAAGQVLGHDRDEFPTCPLANINSFDEFTNRKTILCQPTLGKYEQWLKDNSNFMRKITDQEIAEMSRVYEKYYLDEY